MTRYLLVLVVSFSFWIEHWFKFLLPSHYCPSHHSPSSLTVGFWKMLVLFSLYRVKSDLLFNFNIVYPNEVTSLVPRHFLIQDIDMTSQPVPRTHLVLFTRSKPNTQKTRPSMKLVPQKSNCNAAYNLLVV